MSKATTFAVEGTLKQISRCEVSLTVGNHATNPFFLEDLFDTTIHEHHNNWPYWYR
jgi:hypothetical protein